MNRSDLQLLAGIRIREAQTLLRAGYASGAYYLAGYAVEVALKARIAKGIKRHEFPDRKTVMDSYTHNLTALLRLAGLEQQLAIDAAASPKLEVAWAVVKDWNEGSRYRQVALPEAHDLVQAVGTRVNGVLPWIRRSW